MAGRQLNRPDPGRLRTRQRQIRNFLRPEAKEGPLGFRFRRSDGADIAESEKRECAAIERFLLNGGDTDDPCERDRPRPVLAIMER